MKLLTQEQHEEAKQEFIAKTANNIDIENANDLKALIREMYERICKLESDKYDLEKRHIEQHYQIRELAWRERKYGRFPSKIPLHNKYDRQVDRRDFGERRTIFDKKDSSPCFPNVPPPPSIPNYKPKKDADVY
uniref:Uncharacterized protein n=1 Tax=Panagrolaimus superbus TaxID=310955 RepID=A0A914ZAZ9_9BILA